MRFTQTLKSGGKLGKIGFVSCMTMLLADFLLGLRLNVAGGRMAAEYFEKGKSAQKRGDYEEAVEWYRNATK